MSPAQSLVEKNEVVMHMCLNSPTLPFLPCLVIFCISIYTSYFHEISKFQHFDSQLLLIKLRTIYILLEYTILAL